MAHRICQIRNPVAIQYNLVSLACVLLCIHPDPAGAPDSVIAHRVRETSRRDKSEVGVTESKESKEEHASCAVKEQPKSGSSKIEFYSRVP